jgi:hypothetical protein
MAAEIFGEVSYLIDVFDIPEHGAAVHWGRPISGNFGLFSNRKKVGLYIQFGSSSFELVTNQTHC